ncbi:MAG: hypothetical protein GX567_01435, partial [Clostridia bacterium]|nr:hypothetical protein [Clostridia bacterium]
SLTSLADIQVGTSLTQDYMELIQSRPVVKQVINNLKMDITYEKMVKKISINNPSSTRILNIVVTDENPQTAKLIADEFAKVSQLQISSIMQTDPPSIVEFGYANEKPVSPNIIKNTVIGGLLGAFLAVAIVVVVYLLDDSVKTSDDIEKYLGLNTLASIPLRDETGKGKKRSKTKKATKVKRASNGMYGHYVAHSQQGTTAKKNDSLNKNAIEDMLPNHELDSTPVREAKVKQVKAKEVKVKESKLKKDPKAEALKTSLHQTGLQISSLEDEDFDID